MKYLLLLFLFYFWFLCSMANPHSAKSETLLQELDMRLDPMPEFMRDEILEGIFLLNRVIFPGSFYFKIK